MTPDVFTADYTGEPGRRAFFLQGRTTDETLTFALEKQQVSLLAEKLSEMLLLIDRSDTVSGASPARDPALESWIAEPEWRIGTIGLSYDESEDRVVVAIQAVQTEDEPEADEGLEEEPVGDDPETVSFVLRRDQVRAFVLHALSVVGEGRPLCQLCGLPMDPQGHACPASNGHHPHA